MHKKNLAMNVVGNNVVVETKELDKVAQIGKDLGLKN